MKRKKWRAFLPLLLAAGLWFSTVCPAYGTESGYAETEQEIGTEESRPEAETEVPSENEAEPDAEVPPESEAGPDSGAPSESEAGPDAEAPSESEAGPDAEVPSESETGPDSEVPSESEAEPDEEILSESEPGPDAEAPSESKPGPDAEAPSESEPGPDMEAPSESGPKTDTERSPGIDEGRPAGQEPGNGPKTGVEPPKFAVKGIIGGRDVTFSSNTEGAVIYYSRTTSSITTDDVSVANGETVTFTSFYGTIYAKAYKDGQWSNVSRLILKIPSVNTPTITPRGNKLVIATTTPGTAIYYTTDGSNPSPDNGTRAGGSSVSIDNVSGTVKAVAVRSCFSNSAVAMERGVVDASKIKPPSFTVKGVIGGRSVIFNAEEGSVVYYSISSRMTTQDAHVKAGEGKAFEDFYGTIYARAYKDGKWSNPARLILKIPNVNKPLVSVIDGYATIYTTTPSCTIYYTTDSSEPSPANGRRISGSRGRVYVGTGAKVRAVAVRSCFTSSKIGRSITPNLANYSISMSNLRGTDRIAPDSYGASVPGVISFFDGRGYYNVAYEASNGNICIQRHNAANMAMADSIQIVKRYGKFGNVTCDAKGNYYVIWGKTDESGANTVTLCVSQYSYDGKFQKECTFKGYDTGSYGSEWGTKDPFSSGNCSVTVNNGVLACNYARTMYNGHQSNHVVYVRTDNMARLDGMEPYCSHSFDERVIPLSDNGFLMANQGDAYSRSFNVTYVVPDRSNMYGVWNFHFREGSNRSHGYNETYAQMGCIAETANGFVFCGSSERTLSLSTAPTNTSYCGHSEARDLFIQVLKKDFYNYSGAGQYLTRGTVRKAVGARPANAETELWLQGNEADYGILWLTQYDTNHYAHNPKVAITEDGYIVVMWERRSYNNAEEVNSYFQVLTENGTVLVAPVELRGTALANDIDVAYRNGRLYWTTSVQGIRNEVHCLEVPSDIDG